MDQQHHQYSSSPYCVLSNDSICVEHYYVVNVEHVVQRMQDSRNDGKALVLPGGRMPRMEDLEYPEKQVRRLIFIIITQYMSLP